MSPGALFRKTLATQGFMSILGVIHAYAALLAARAGATCIYLSGAGLANSVYGLPDLALTSLTDLVSQAEKITDVCALPLLVDIDTGFGSILNIARSIRLLEKAGVAAIHIEDQVFEKRCGHRDGKQLVSSIVMGDRIKAAVDARQSEDFVVMARTDALTLETSQEVLARIDYYQSCGADMIFLEAIPNLASLGRMAKHIQLPILVNSTEFGKTPIHSQAEWREQGANMVLYPLTAFRAMSKVAMEVYKSILSTGSQAQVLNDLQTRQDLYDILNYDHYETLLEGANHA